MYHDHKLGQLRPDQRAHADIDLRFATLMTDLALPQRAAHDALNDAVMAGLAFVKLRRLGMEPLRPPDRNGSVAALRLF